MSIALVADAHLGGPGGDAGPLIEQLAALPGRGCRRLVVLGDLFQAWVGFRQFETEDVRRTVAALAELRADGVRLEYVEGNRDFFIGDGVYGSAFDAVVAELSFEAGGRRYLAVHGDGLDHRDRQYRAWRRLSKSLAVRWAMAYLPVRVARRVVATTEQKLSRTNLEHKAEIPRRVIERWAEGRLAEGYDEVVLGHFHEPHLWPVAGGQVRLVDAWFRSRRIEWPERWAARPAVSLP